MAWQLLSGVFVQFVVYGGDSHLPNNQVHSKRTHCSAWQTGPYCVSCLRRHVAYARHCDKRHTNGKSQGWLTAYSSQITLHDVTCFAQFCQLLAFTKYIILSVNKINCSVNLLVSQPSVYILLLVLYSQCVKSKCQGYLWYRIARICLCLC